MELHWPLVLFTIFVAWSAGVFGTQALLAIRGYAKKSQTPIWIVAAILLIVGGVAVVFHLQHWERIFNGFGNPTSGITQELVMVVVVAVVALVYLIVLRRNEDHHVPAWLCIVSIVLCIVLIATMAHSYMMPARPAWDNVLWILYVFGNACAAGPLTVALVMTFTGDDLAVMKLPALVGTGIGIVFAIAFAIFLLVVPDSFVNVGYYFDPTTPAAGMTNVSRTIDAQAPLSWIGGVVVGGIGAFVCALIGYRKSTPSMWRILSIIGLVCVVAGMLCMRIAFYNAGLSMFVYY